MSNFSGAVLKQGMTLVRGHNVRGHNVRGDNELPSIPDFGHPALDRAVLLLNTQHFIMN